MEGDDVLSHINTMAKAYDRLNSLVTTDKPLTVADVHSAALLSSIPDDWMGCVSHLMNQEGVSTESIVLALKNEHTRRHSQNEVAISVSSTKTKSHTGKRPGNQNKKPRHCDFCNADGHDLNNCNNTRRILDEHKASQKTRTDSKDQDRKPNQSSKPAARAGRTSAVTLGGSSHAYDEDDESDYSGSEIEITAGNAVASLSVSNIYSGTGDANLDSGCSMSMTPDILSVENLKTDCTPVRLADHSVVEATHRGISRLPIDGETKVKTLVVPSLHEPLLSVAALCDAGLTVVFNKASCDIFKSNDTKIEGDLAGRGYRRGNLYYLPSDPVRSCSSLSLSPLPPDHSLLGYHQRFSHIGLKPLKALLKSNKIVPSVMNEIEVQRCPTCVQAKMPRKAFKSRAAHRSSKPGQLIHSDVASYEVVSREGYKYFITFIDDCSKFLYVFPMKLKSDSFACFKIFRAFFEKSGSHTIIALRTDNGGEYLSNEFSSYLASSGIRHEPGPPHSPQLNGVAERTNRTINNLVRASLIQANLPKSFWTDALRHSMFPFNSFPCHTPLGFKSPSSILQEHSVDLKSIHPFGCLVWYKIPEANSKSLDIKGRASLLLSYLPDGNGFRLWDLEKRSVVKSRDVLFEDTTFPYGAKLKQTPEPVSIEIAWPKPSNDSPEDTHHPQRTEATSTTPPIDNDAPLDIPLAPRFDRRLTASIHAPHNRPRDPLPISSDSDSDSSHNPIPISPVSSSDSNYNKPDPSPSTTSPDVKVISLPPLPPSPPPPPVSPTPSSQSTPPRSPPAKAPSPTPSPPPIRRRSNRDRRAPDRYGHWSKNASTDCDVDTPKTWRQLLKSPNKHRWLKAADEEFASLLGMQTWKLVPRPEKRKVIKSKWVFKVKRRPDRTIQKLKARLVAMGYSQVHGLDYDEVFSPTLRLETLRLILSLLACRNWTGRQVDFKTAFLNGHLDKPIYMEQPPGFEDPQHPDWVCEVNRSLYGLKQSPRQWNIELHKALLELGLSNSKYDPTLYFKLRNNKLIGALTTHVDDLAIVGEHDFVNSLISEVGKRFKIGADEELNHFLSLKITRNAEDRHVFLNQAHYISELSARFLNDNPTPVATPTDSIFKNLRPRSQSDPVSSGPYPQLIGSLLWVSQCTRPDISFAVNRLSQFLRDPSESHWQAGLRILNYLITTKDL
jgi:transposase InsO family protein